MPARRFVVVSGLPGSGKTTLATRLADALDLPLLDKDTILEALFDSEPAVDALTRQRLSRASDTVLARIAAAARGAVIVSFWRHPGGGGTSGTPTDWLRDLSPDLVEVYCACPPDIAEQRFRARRRHPGHNDALRAGGLADQLRHLSALGPLGIARCITVATDRPYDPAEIAARIRA